MKKEEQVKEFLKTKGIEGVQAETISKWFVEFQSLTEPTQEVVVSAEEVKIYLAQYCPCTEESAYATLSIHFIKEDAQNAINNHKLKCEKEFSELYKNEVPPFKFDEFKDWAVEETIIQGAMHTYASQTREEEMKKNAEVINDLTKSLESACSFIRKSPKIRTEDEYPKGIERWEEIITKSKEFTKNI